MLSKPGVGMEGLARGSLRQEGKEKQVEAKHRARGWKGSQERRRQTGENAASVRERQKQRGRKNRSQG